jgi:hypothetical protein
VRAAQQVAAGWDTLRWHPEQARFWTSRARFQIAPAGRRSGKSVIARRKAVRFGLASPFVDGRCVLAAPTRPHAKDLHWEPLKRLVPDQFVSSISETELKIKLLSGFTFQVMGLERPQRIEGSPLDLFVGDEWADVRPYAWPRHILPALDTPGREGGSILIGVPEGRNHYYDQYRAAREGLPGWAAFHWKSADILPPHIIEQARANLDPLVFQQEYEADFIVFSGRAYYNYRPDFHGVERVAEGYSPEHPLILMFDFNVDPGVCAIGQEMKYEGDLPNVAEDITAVIGEVYIPRNSNTEAVCRRILKDWGEHPGDVLVYGDPSGGGRRTVAAKPGGNDWDIVREVLRPHFGTRLRMRVKKAPPSERSRINAVNSRFRDASGTVKMLIDPRKAPKTCRDFEGVTLLEGGSGEIDKGKHKDDGLTHLSDGVGYYIAARYPVRDAGLIEVTPLD